MNSTVSKRQAIKQLGDPVPVPPGTYREVANGFKAFAERRNSTLAPLTWRKRKTLP